MSSGPKTRGSYGPNSPRGQALAQKQRDAMQAVKNQDMAKKMQEAYERFGRSSESDSPGYKKGGKIKKMAGGGPGSAPGMPSKRIGPAPSSSRPRSYDEELRDRIATPVIPDQAKYPEYVEEVGEERVSGPRMRKGGIARSSASKRADGCAVKGKTRGKFV